ncbi:MAG: hypothetical protein ABIJ26_06110 [Candidatus Margulisiibacteriota bacterium]
MISLKPGQTKLLLCEIWPGHKMYLNGLEAGKTYELSFGRIKNKEKRIYESLAYLRQVDTNLLYVYALRTGYTFHIPSKCVSKMVVAAPGEVEKQDVFISRLEQEVKTKKIHLESSNTLLLREEDQRGLLDIISNKHHPLRERALAVLLAFYGKKIRGCVNYCVTHYYPNNDENIRHEALIRAERIFSDLATRYRKDRGATFQGYSSHFLKAQLRAELLKGVGKFRHMQIVSLDVPIAADSRVTHEDRLVSPEASPEEMLLIMEQKGLMGRIRQGLEADEYEALLLRFGEGLTLEQIGRNDIVANNAKLKDGEVREKISKQAVSLLLRSALSKARRLIGADLI